jgi:hypothetical protein
MKALSAEDLNFFKFDQVYSNESGYFSFLDFYSMNFVNAQSLCIIEIEIFSHLFSLVLFLSARRNH